jgi:hypothetical protein
MSRKYYEMLARLLKESDNLEQFKMKLCRELYKDNNRFNEDRFLSACEK